MNEITDIKWYEALIEECQAIITEKVYRSRMELIEAKHMVGERICTDTNFKKIKGGRAKHSFLKQCFKDIGIGQADGYYCVQFYEKFPKLSTAVDSFKEQKNISWWKIRDLLPDIKPERPILHRGAKIDLKLGDFRELIKKLPKDSIDLILTDPPYPKEYRQLWEDLAREGKRVLRPGGFMVAYSGQNGLPEILNMVGKYLEYYWLGCLYHKGGVGQRFEVNMFNRGKPILFFFKPPLKKQEGWIDDVLISEKEDKDFHEWGQSVLPLEKIVNAFTKEDDIVLDPFFGGGSVIEACAKLNRNVVGFEIDKEYYNLVSKRLK